MPIVREACRLNICRLSVDLWEFPDLLRQHRKSDPMTLSIEEEGARLVSADFNTSAVSGFVRRVCSWGGYAGIGGRVLKRNEMQDIAATLRDAHGLALQSRPAEAVERLCRLKGLGISFASKHLKFLAPERAVVLDSIIAGRLGYALTPSGYAELLADCGAMLAHIRIERIPHPFPEEGTWRVSDVEMAVYQKLRS